MNTTLLIIEFIFLLGFCIFLTWYFPAPSVPNLCRATVFVTWFLGFAGIILLCADLASAQEENASLHLLPWWNVIYWSTFALAWFIEPLMNFYYRGGQFDKWPAFVSSVKFNLKWYVILGIFVLVMILYGIIALKASLSTMIGLTIAMGNTYGLILIILLLGHGLITLPRKLWTYRDPDTYCKELCLRAVHVSEEMQDAMYDLKDIETEISLAANQYHINSTDIDSKGNGYRTQEEEKMVSNLRYVLEMAKKFKYSPTWSSSGDYNKNLSKSDWISNSSSTRINPSSSSSSTIATLSSIDVVTLNSSLLWCQQSCYSEQHRWHDIISQTLANQALSESGNTVKLLIRKWFYSLISIICMILTATTLWCEMTLWHRKSDLSVFALLIKLTLDSGSNDSYSIQLVSIVPLLYLSVCMYYSFFRLKFFGIFTLYGPHLSNPTQLFFSSQFLCRLQFSLCYHYLLLLNYKHTNKTAFAQLMSGMEIIPILGTGFNIYGPLLLVILAFFTLFHGYAKLLRLMGVDHDDAYVLDKKFDLGRCTKLFKRPKDDHQDHDEDQQDEDEKEVLERLSQGKSLISIAISRARYNQDNEGL